MYFTENILQEKKRQGLHKDALNVVKKLCNRSQSLLVYVKRASPALFHPLLL